MNFYKDESLDVLAEKGNVAQFISYAPDANAGLIQRFSRVAGFPPNHQFDTLGKALGTLLEKSSERSVNIRSFFPGDPRSKEFVYGLKDIDSVRSTMERLASSGLFLIVNETVDVTDGGVSGVVQGDVIEFAPDDTPRCVEKPGVASLQTDLGLRILETVYGFRPDLNCTRHERIEFSIHPRVRGWRQTQTLFWERETGVFEAALPKLDWPNKFSRHLGDKVYGLIMANELGFSVPRTVVIGRRVAPFSFGTETGSHEVWTRTSPYTPQPGLYTTVKGWTDPFALLASEDPDGQRIASVLCQAAVSAEYSGAAIVSGDGELIVEGIKGEGDRFMLGIALPQQLPIEIVGDVNDAFLNFKDRLGAVRFEWVHDGKRVWIVQLHRGSTDTVEGVLVPGDAKKWEQIDATMSLERIRNAISQLEQDTGLVLLGDIGLTSHIADVVRKARRPARLKRYA